jgi:hypothetical protein
MIMQCLCDLLRIASLVNGFAIFVRDRASAAPSSNHIVAACGLPTTPRAALAFVSPYPPKPSHMNDTRKALPRCSSLMTLQLCVCPSRKNFLSLHNRYIT